MLLRFQRGVVYEQRQINISFRFRVLDSIVCFFSFIRKVGQKYRQIMIQRLVKDEEKAEMMRLGRDTYIDEGGRYTYGVVQ